MNIFFLYLTVIQAAQAHVDSHVRKMILESLQLLSLAWLFHNPEIKSPHLYQVSRGYLGHPMAVWTRQSPSNYTWLGQLAIALCQEFEYRFGKKHAHESRVAWAAANLPPALEKLGGGPTTVPLAMASEFQHAVWSQQGSKDWVAYWTRLINLGETTPVADPVASYRYYYVRGKVHLLQYTRRTPPAWVAPMLGFREIEQQLRKQGLSVYYYHQPLEQLYERLPKYLPRKAYTREQVLELVYYLHQWQSYSIGDWRTLAQRYNIKGRSKDELISRLLTTSASDWGLDRVRLLCT